MNKIIDMKQVSDDMRNAQEDMNKIFQRLCEKHDSFNFDPDVMYTLVTKQDGTSKRHWELTIAASLELGWQGLEK